MSDRDAGRNLPDWMMIWWFFCSPFAFMLALRTAWEKTVWTWQRGPQVVGFSLWHLHPGFAILGLISWCGLGAWFLVAILLTALRRKRLSGLELVMFVVALFVTVAITIPDTFFASAR